MNRRRSAVRVWWLVLGGAMACLARPAAAQTEFLIVLRDGNQWIAKLDQAELPWREIRPDGSVVERTATMESIVSVEFSQQSVSELAAEIRRLVEQLGSSDYHVRNASEEQLLKQGGQFVDVIQHARENPNPEVRYRVNRLLTKLQGKGVKQVSAEYDEIRLESSAAPVRGDLGEWTPSIQVFGQSVPLNRQAVLAMHKLDRDSAREAGATRPDSALSLTEPGEHFYLANDVHVDFDSGRRGESFLVSENIANAYQHLGIVLSAPGDPPGSVIAAGFRISQSRSAKNSAATMSMGNRYKGTLRIDFCHPFLPSVPATVYRVGCYVAVVQDPGEIVMRAFDRQGNLVGAAWATDKTSFLGVVSPQPIAWVTISSNRDLPVPESEIDDDFAIDDLVFDPPRVDELQPCGPQSAITMRDGSRILGSKTRIDAQHLRLEQTAVGSEPIALPWSEVRAMAVGNRAWEPRVAQLWGVFTDGSLLPLQIPASSELQTADFANSRIERESLAAVFGSDHGLTIPPAGWIRADRSLVVHPFGYQRIRELQIEPGRVGWGADSTETLMPVGLESLTRPDWPVEFPPTKAPSIWFQELGPPQPSWGVVELVDRRRLSVGPGAQFQIARLTDAELVVVRESTEWAIPWENIKAVLFPEP